MNIETLMDYIKLFNTEVIQSGFHRDIQDYMNSLGNYQNDIVNQRRVAEEVRSTLEKIHSGDLPDALYKLLPKEGQHPFTAAEHLKNLNELIADTEIQQNEFFNNLQNIINKLNEQLTANLSEIKKIETFLIPYSLLEEERITAENKAIVSLIFKDTKTINSLKEFSKTIHIWNRTLLVYHQISTSLSPEDIELIEVQNSSIDFLINLDIDVAINLVELFRIGLQVYGAYLLYKKGIKPITDSYFGNKKLLQLDKEREKVMLENIADSITKRIKEQHKAARKKDTKIESNIDKGAEEVTKLLTSHIIRGNDMKLLFIPSSIEGEAKDNIEKNNIEFRRISADARNTLKELPEKVRNVLLDKYGSLDKNDKE